MTDEQIRKRNLFDHYMSQVKRPGRKDLMKMLEENGFYEAPASTHYHLAYPGGLCEHSVNVCQELMKLAAVNKLNKIKKETLIVCGCLHDLCKLDMYKKTENGYEYNKAGAWPMGHGEKSVVMILKYMELSDEEMLAIRWHMGAWDEAVKGGSRAINEAMEKSLLVPMLQIADQIATYINEREEK